MAFAKLPSGASLYFEKVGEGKPLILLHGWALSSSVWALQVDAFKNSYSVYTLDFRGHGLSDHLDDHYTLSGFVSDVSEFMDEAEIPQATLLGWSMGGMVAMQLAASFPERVEKLGIISGTPKLVKTDDFPYGAAENIVRHLERQITEDFEKAMGAFYRLIFYGENSLREKRTDIWQAMMRGIKRPHPEAARACFQSVIEGDLRSILPTLQVPTLIIHGALDHICPVGTAYYMNQQIPSSMLHIFPTAAHAPHLTKPEQVNERIRQFLRGEVVAE